ncbi:MAG: hypothetical protein KAQ92_02520, partial [Candidatus Aenigmarchaeota archaeon]|nr:hypothetical protein [Candidatus Aenigmarchaeota archaeon]
EKEGIKNRLFWLAKNEPKKTYEELNILKNKSISKEDIGKFLKTPVGKNFNELLETNLSMRGLREQIEGGEQTNQKKKRTLNGNGRVVKALKNYIGDKNILNWYDFLEEEPLAKTIKTIPLENRKEFIDDLMGRNIELVGIPREKIIDTTNGTEKYRKIIKKLENKGLPKRKAELMAEIVMGASISELKKNPVWGDNERKSAFRELKDKGFIDGYQGKYIHIAQDTRDLFKEMKQEMNEERSKISENQSSDPKEEIPVAEELIDENQKLLEELKK